MDKRPGRPRKIEGERVSIRVLIPKAYYEILQARARVEATDISSLVRRALAKEYFLPSECNTNRVLKD